MNKASPKKHLPDELTSYDLVKAFAVITMIIDHLGYYLFPDELWMRAIGRLSMPVWFFLIGYARTRDVPFKYLLGAGILVAMNPVVGLAVLPFNVLVTISIVRVTIEPVMAYIKKSRTNLLEASLFLMILAVPTYMISEYGAQAMLIAVFGYLVRHKDEMRQWPLLQTPKKVLKPQRIIFSYAVFALSCYLIIQWVVFGVPWPLMILVTVGTSMILMGLYRFSYQTYPKLTKALPVILTWPVQLVGRRSLEVYVVHLIILKLMSLALGYAGFSFLNFRII